MCSSDLTDHLARDDEHAIAITREIVGDLGNAGSQSVPVSPLLPFEQTKTHRIREIASTKT